MIHATSIGTCGLLNAVCRLPVHPCTQTGTHHTLGAVAVLKRELRIARISAKKIPFCDDSAPFPKYLVDTFFLTPSHQATKPPSHQATKNYAGVLLHPPIPSWLRVLV